MTHAVERSILVQISDDGLSASISIDGTPADARPVSEADVQDALRDAGVVYGVDPIAVRGLVTEAPTGLDGGRPTVVAQGLLPTPGADAEVSYHEVLQAVVGRPALRPDGSVDFHNLGVVRSVVAGTTLATLVPATAGEPGMGVTGAPLRAEKGRPRSLRAGQGACLSEDGLVVTATASGHATLLGDQVAVTPVFEVGSDVGVATGDIEFPGTVKVRGGVLAGFRVKAEGDVELQGAVDGGVVEAGGSVVVSYGIQGRGRVTAGGSVRARFIQNAVVTAKGDVWAADGLVQSEVEAGGTIEVLGRHGSVVSGRTRSRRGVFARLLGSELGVATEIAVADATATRVKLAALRHELTLAEDRLERVQASVESYVLQGQHGALSEEKRARLEQLAAAQEQLIDTRAALEDECRALERDLRELGAVAVEAREQCFPGVQLTIGEAHLRVDEPHRAARFQPGGHGLIEIVAAHGRS